MHVFTSFCLVHTVWIHAKVTANPRIYFLFQILFTIVENQDFFFRKFQILGRLRIKAGYIICATNLKCAKKQWHMLQSSLKELLPSILGHHVKHQNHQEVSESKQLGK